MSSTAHEAAVQIRTLLSRVGQRLRPSASDADEQARRWLVVTVEGTPEDIAPAGELPAPLADLGAAIEVDLRPAPGGRGTELAARIAAGTSIPTAGHPLTGHDSRQQLRAALRRAKQLVEVGEVLVAEPRPEGYRPRTIAGRLVDKAEQTSDSRGVL